MNIKGYDDWKLASPWDDCHEIGTEDGQTCGRVAEPDEDAPRGYRPRPCGGLMIEADGVTICESCGEIA
ncbi:MAG: hypothetical protein Tp118SUR00d2C21406231_42 [Prokaryotic dsDNA virus sp.]|mgnify:CR=1 FL=1|nr:MAG: hypothetical protein Tp125DCM00d2C40298531_61 [Prokaryotic dsDNA virus sp.]QDP53162.1 MAG: hypothetical protein Tp118SUR00d2C21406231_42 [Prokaryotic dsDNA virus sp.]|tara:strand:- start:25527 stop:25733 length:207 start_codon:yes stop_codon:yes gene_type:complete